MPMAAIPVLAPHIVAAGARSCRPWNVPFRPRALLLLLAAHVGAVEHRGTNINMAMEQPVQMSSQGTILATVSEPYMSVDGNTGQHAYLDGGCSVTMTQFEPWWRVDLGFEVPIQVVRVWGRSDVLSDHIRDGLQVQAGGSPYWKGNPACIETLDIPISGVAVRNCLSVGPYVFIGAPEKEGSLALCEVHVLPAGPQGWKEWKAAIARPLNLYVEGQGLHPNDRIRIVTITTLCGSDSSYWMTGALVPNSKPDRPPDYQSTFDEEWRDIQFMRRGFFKVCWCSGLSPCNTGTHFSQALGLIFVTGQLDTLLGDENVWDGLTDTGLDPFPLHDTKLAEGATGITVWSGDTLYYSEPHRVRRISLLDETVVTVVGGVGYGICRDRGNCLATNFGNATALYYPKGLSRCDGVLTTTGAMIMQNILIIADTQNHRILGYDPETFLVETLMGTGSDGYSGDGGPPLSARLDSPSSAVCDPHRELWVSDTGNNLIRLVRRGIVSTEVGQPNDDGFSPVGEFSLLSYMLAPQQITRSRLDTGEVLSIVYAEEGNNVGRYIPIPNLMNSASGYLLRGAGTGPDPDWRNAVASEDDQETIQMNAPQGAAAQNGAVYYADTMNHRIIMTPVQEYWWMGCWKERAADPLIPSLEDNIYLDDILTGTPGFLVPTNFPMRNQAVHKCAKAALRLGYEYFALRDGGICCGAADTALRYTLLGTDDGCLNGVGGAGANEVYRLILTEFSSEDLIDREFIVIGTGMSAGENTQPPQPGFYGDTLSAWTSMVFAPRHMDFDREYGNLYLIDHNNWRIRVMFGDHGPKPNNQELYCINGLGCTLSIKGNALNLLDSVGFVRMEDGETSGDVVCGQDDMNLEFPQAMTTAESRSIFFQKRFPLGTLALRQVGRFQVCYCNSIDTQPCELWKDFDLKAGVLTVEGVDNLKQVVTNTGARFDVVLTGRNLSSHDRIRIIRASYDCGVDADISSGDQVGVNPGLAWLDRERTSGDETYSAWQGIAIMRSGTYVVCWCDMWRYDCSADRDYMVRAMSVHVQGPVPMEMTVEAGQHFQLTLYGIGGFDVQSRVVIQPAFEECNASSFYNADPGFSRHAAPCAFTRTSATWCDVMVQRSGQQHVCFCGSAADCVYASNYNVLAMNLTVTNFTNSQGVPSTFYEPDWPLNTLNGSWPEQLMPGLAYQVKLRTRSRWDVPGSSSAGPVNVTVCEHTDHCALPLLMYNLGLEDDFDEMGGLFENIGSALTPRFLRVRFMSPDAWLPEFIDLAIDNQWRRFPLNRWMVDFDPDVPVSAPSPWSKNTPPPYPGPATSLLYTEGDHCGGCALGFHCVEQQIAGMEFALLSPGNSTTGWACIPTCGDGMVSGFEQCDDWNLMALDGCDTDCRVEGGYVCHTAYTEGPSECEVETCQGVADGKEVCGLATEVSSGNLIEACRFPQDTRCSFGSYSVVDRKMLWPSCEDWLLNYDSMCAGWTEYPRPTSASLMDQGRMLVITFDMPLAVAVDEIREDRGVNATGNCSLVLAPTTTAALGDLHLCYWVAPEVLTVRIGFGATIGIPGLGPLAVEILREALVRTDQGSVTLYPWDDHIVTFKLKNVEEVAETPLVRLRAPPTAGTCGDVEVDGLTSTGSMGRKWTNIVWTCSGTGCTTIDSLLPHECMYRAVDTSLDAGPVPCGLSFFIPEDAAISLAAMAAEVVIGLALTNAAGFTGAAYHTMHFVNKRVPITYSITGTEFYFPPDPEQELYFEVVARAASCDFGGSLGAVTVSWAVGLSYEVQATTTEELSLIFDTLSPVPDTLQTTGSLGVLAGTLGPLATLSSIWILVARVAHTDATQPTASAEPVFHRITIYISTLAPMNLKMTAPSTLGDSCPFSVEATARNTSVSTFSWQCSLTDLYTTTAFDWCEVAAAGMDTTSLDLIPQADGIYLFTVNGGAPGVIDRAFAYVVVDSTSAGPPVRINEPSEPGTRSNDPDDDSAALVFHATVSGMGDCMTTPLYAAVSIVGKTHHDVTPLVFDVRVLTSSMMLGAFGDTKNVTAEVAVVFLGPGLIYNFLLLLSDNQTLLDNALLRMNQMGSMYPLEPITGTSFDGVWVYESYPTLRAVPVSAAFWAEPPQGWAARTLFRLRARALCDACEFAYRYVQLQAGESCGNTTAEWQALRDWSADPEAWVAFLAGNFAVEARVRSPDGGLSKACETVIVQEAASGSELTSAETAAEAEQLIEDWALEVSRTLDAFRSTVQPLSLMHAINSIATEFPSSQAFEDSYSVSMSPSVVEQLQALYRDICNVIIETLDQLDHTVFLPGGEPSLGEGRRRLQEEEVTNDNPLVPASDALLLIIQRLAHEASMTELQRTLETIDAMLVRNMEFTGLLGAAAVGIQPPVMPSLLGVSSEILTLSANIGDASAPAFRYDVLDAVLRLGDVFAAATTPDEAGRPVSVAAAAGGMKMSVKRYSKAYLEAQGINIQLNYQSAELAFYPGVQIPALGVGGTDVLLATLGSEVGSCIGPPGTSTMDFVDLIILHWATNPHEGMSAADAGRNFLIDSLHEVQLRTCGLSTSPGPAELGGSGQTEFVFEIPEQLAVDLSWGYDDLSPYLCMSWVETDSQWTSSACTPVHPAPGGTLAGLPENQVTDFALLCVCDTLWPSTWGVSIVPRPPEAEEDPVRNSWLNWVTYGSIITWVSLFVFLGYSWWGDILLDLDHDPTAADLLKVLPNAEDEGSSGAVTDLLQQRTWPLRSGFTHACMSMSITLHEILGIRERGPRSLETQLMPYHRMALRAQKRGLLSNGKGQNNAAIRDSKEPQLTDHAHRPKKSREEALEDIKRARMSQSAQASQVTSHQASSRRPGSLRDAAAAHHGLHDGSHPASANTFSTTASAAPMNSMGTATQNFLHKANVHNNAVTMDTHAVLSSALGQDYPRKDELSWDDQIRGEVDAANRHGNNYGKFQQEELTAKLGQLHEDQQAHRSPPGELPEGWLVQHAEDNVYYVNLLSGRSTWDFPGGPAVKELSVAEMRALLGPTADRVQLRVDLEAMLRPRIYERAEMQESAPQFQVTPRDEESELIAGEIEVPGRVGPHRGSNHAAGRHHGPAAQQHQHHHPHHRDQQHSGHARPQQFHREARHRAAVPLDLDKISQEAAAAVAFAVPGSLSTPSSSSSSRSRSPIARPGAVSVLAPVARPRFMTYGVHGAPPPLVEAWAEPPQAELRAMRLGKRLEKEGCHTMAPPPPPPHAVANAPANGHHALQPHSTHASSRHSSAPPSAREQRQLEHAPNNALKVFEDLGMPPEIIFHRRLAFASWGFWKTWFWCAFRSSPILHVLAPRAAPPRLRRAAEIAAQLSWALVLSTLSSSVCDCGLGDETSSDKSDVDELVDAFGVAETFPLGFAAYLLSLPLAALALMPVDATRRPLDIPIVQRLSWWGTVRRSFTVNSLMMILLSLLLTVAAVFLGAQQGHMRCAIGFAMFLVSALFYFFVSPICKAFGQAVILRGFARWDCFNSFVSCCPWMLDFSLAQVHITQWTDPYAVIGHLEAVAAERKSAQAKLTS